MSGSRRGAGDNGEAATRIVACPTCRKSVPWTANSRFRPFCSARCRLIDLGAWADGSRHIPGDADWESPGDEERE